MAFDYGAKLSAIVSKLRDHNTTTASPDLSSGLSTRMTNTSIVADDPEIRGIRNDEYPAIFIRISDASEEWGGIGPTGANGAFKTKTVKFHVLGFYRREGAGQTHESLLGEMHQLAENIEGVVRAEYRMSDTALWIQPNFTDFIGPFADDAGGWIKVVRVELEGRYHFR